MTEDAQARRSRRIKPFDVFIALNAAFLIGSTLYAYAVAELEFGLYAVTILGIAALGWWYLRRYDYPIWLLVLVQVGIVAHFAGGFLYPTEGVSLYNHYFAGIRYDKFVHFYNSMVAAIVLSYIFREAGLDLGAFEAFIVVMVTLGLGALIEIVEYFAVLTVPNTGVGDYANNIQDLIVNLFGGLTGVLLWETGQWLACRRQATA
jgi:uncharacterized membrane protein YjdF